MFEFSFFVFSVFSLNLRRYPTIKWQYFMSADGLHTEYPAHRPGVCVCMWACMWKRVVCCHGMDRYEFSYLCLILFFCSLPSPGTSIGSDCGQSSRHRHIYEASVRPRGRNIVLLYDLGETLTPRLLITAKAIGEGQGNLCVYYLCSIYLLYYCLDLN